ncbi:cysteine desulfurase family protein [Olivibacter domesticus]|uniref:cysteine desulfurase n=1 Tax=Olivibacter domesticus TaxID=407022 RepID=A0A1H7PUT4_OLID1|nr:cysteine desulfurase family protein [Olivibacter domesticus]SEL39154.1 cysteine desulfurase [Olivibacter domesticus]
MQNTDQSIIYLDHCATTPVDSMVLDTMLPYFKDYYGNASSIHHKLGRKAAEAIEIARNQVAKLLHASTKEIIFTSGATEAINQALSGIFLHYQQIGKHIITCETEHPAVLDTCNYLSRKGADIQKLPVDQKGNISLNDLQQAIRQDTILICFMFANNETGVIHPIDQIGEIAKEHNVLFFCDATQAVGKIPVNVKTQHIDVLALSAHKIYGPKGVGALFIKRRSAPIQIGSLLQGGKQENNLRAGTLNVPGIVGLGAAASLAMEMENQEISRVSKLRDYLENSLLQIPETFLNGDALNRLPHVSNICFQYVKSTEIMANLPQLALSAGSACASGSLEPSHVLTAMGLNKEKAESSIRFSLGYSTTEDQINQTIELIINAIGDIRNNSPLWQLHKAGVH